MDARSSRGVGWIAFSSAVLIVGGAFAIIDGMMAVYRSRFFSSSAVYAFSDLKTWGWIVFGLGVAAVVAGIAVLSGREWARWLGVIVAGLNAVGQLLFAQAYPLWSLIIIGVDIAVIYGLTAYGSTMRAAESVSSVETPQRVETTSRQETLVDTSEQDRESRAA
jgi:hypothetical protein